MDALRHAIRVRHYSIRTEEAYVDWARRFIRFHGRRHPRELGASEVAAFLTHLAVDRTVAPSTQNQARSALMFLYREVLQLELPWLQEVVAAKTQRRLPVVLTPSEVRALLGELSGTMGLVAALLYGTGLRLLEALRLRVKDIGFEQRELVVRDGKGGKDRVTVLPENLIAPLQQQLGQARALHQQDLAEGFGEVWLPDALAGKHPAMPRAWGWQWAFPSAVRSADPRSGVVRRHHLHEASVQKAVSTAARRAGIVKPCSPHVLRHYSESRNMPSSVSKAVSLDGIAGFPRSLNSAYSMGSQIAEEGHQLVIGSEASDSTLERLHLVEGSPFDVEICIEIDLCCRD